MQFNYDDILSVTACLALADQLRKQAWALEYRAKTLKENRNRVPVEKDDFLPVLKVAKAVFLHPNFPEKKERIIIDMACTYDCEIDQLRRCVEYESQKRANLERETVKKTVQIMAAKGKKPKDIARAVDRSPARVSQILKSLRNSRVRRR